MIIEWDFTDLKETFHRSVSFFKTKAKYFLVFIVLGSLLGFLLTFFFQDDQYEATVSLLVDESYTQEDTIKNTNLAIIESYKEVLTSTVIITETIETLKLNGTIQDLREQINVSTNGNSLVMNISVFAESASQARTIAETLTDIFTEKMTVLGNVQDVVVLENIQVKDEVMKPMYAFNMFKGSLYALILSLIILGTIKYEITDKIRKVVKR